MSTKMFLLKSIPLYLTIMYTKGYTTSQMFDEVRLKLELFVLYLEIQTCTWLF